MPFKTELNAISKQYVKLMKLPLKDMLPALTEASVITDGQREKMIAMALDKDRASYLLDNVIIASLKCDNRDLFDSFLQVLEKDEDPLAKKLCEDLKSYLGSRQPPQRQHTYPPQRQHSYPPQEQFPYGQPPQEQFPYGQPPQGQFSYGQPPQRYGQPPQGQFPYEQPPQGQFSYGQPPQGQFSYGQPPQGQFSYGQPPQGQFSYGQPPQGQFSYQRQFSYPQFSPRGQFSPQGEFSPFQKQFSCPPQGQFSYEQPPQGEFSSHMQPQQHSYSEPLQGQLQAASPQFPVNQSYNPQDQPQPQREPCADASSQQSHQPPANATIPSENPPLQVNSANELPPQNLSEGNMHQQKYPQQTENTKSELSVNDPEVQQNPTNQLPEEETVQPSHTSYPSQDEIINVHQNPTNDELQREIPKVLQSRPSQEEIIDVRNSPTNGQPQNEIPKVLQSRPSQEEIIDVRNSPTNGQPQNQIPKVLQSRPSQEEIINVCHSPTDDQTQKEIPKVLQNYPSQEEITDVHHSPTNAQPQNEIPKVLQSHTSQEEIIDVHHNPTDDQTQKEIPKVYLAQEEIIDVHQNPTNDEQQREIPKVLQSPVNYPSHTDIQPPCHDNKMQPSLVSHQSEENSSVNLSQQTLQAGEDTTEPVQGKKMHQHKATDSMQTMRWIECMKSVCRIESKCKGTGVIGYLTIEGSLQYVLLTCHHVIPTEDDAKSACLYFGYTDNTRHPSACNASGILDTSGEWFWSDPTYLVKKKYGLNYSMMKVKKSELDKIMFPGTSRLMNIQGIQLNTEGVHIEVDDCLTLMSQIPHLSVTYGNCTGNPATAVVKYDMPSVQGSAGSPVFKQEAGKPPYMVAMHNGYSETKNHGVNIYVNYGVRLLEILNHCTGKHSLPMPPSGFTYKQE